MWLAVWKVTTPELKNSPPKSQGLSSNSQLFIGFCPYLGAHPIPPPTLDKPMIHFDLWCSPSSIWWVALSWPIPWKPAPLDSPSRGCMWLSGGNKKHGEWPICIIPIIPHLFQAQWPLPQALVGPGAGKCLLAAVLVADAGASTILAEERRCKPLSCWKPRMGLCSPQILIISSRWKVAAEPIQRHVDTVYGYVYPCEQSPMRHLYPSKGQFSICFDWPDLISGLLWHQHDLVERSTIDYTRPHIVHPFPHQRMAPRI